MKPYLILIAALSGCSAPHAVPRFPSCPAPVAVPAGVPKHPTVTQIDALEIRVELAREAERSRGDACSAAVDARDKWIKSK